MQIKYLLTCQPPPLAPLLSFSTFIWWTGEGEIEEGRRSRGLFDWIYTVQTCKSYQLKPFISFDDNIETDDQKRSSGIAAYNRQTVWDGRKRSNVSLFNLYSRNTNYQSICETAKEMSVWNWKIYLWRRSNNDKYSSYGRNFSNQM